ncbi:hypothetical protein FRC07_010193 [Ceratobasidium sp. 392]|nr:hypothetical protein FRC07_010193 [Ceratobasidium sp. 392]
MDFMNQFLPDIPKVNKNIVMNTSMTTVYAPLTIHDNMRFYHLNGTFSGHEYLQQQPGVRDVFGQDSLFVYENFAYVFWSGVLSDLGMSDRTNLLVSADLFDRFIQRNVSVPRGLTLPWLNGPGSAAVLSNKTEFGLPFKRPDPTFFNAQYLCHSIS